VLSDELNFEDYCIACDAVCCGIVYASTFRRNPLLKIYTRLIRIAGFNVVLLHLAPGTAVSCAVKRRHVYREGYAVACFQELMWTNERKEGVDRERRHNKLNFKSGCSL
jgi:hypothetical protein